MTGLTGNNAITGAGYRKNQPPYEIDQSLRVDDGDSANLSRTPSSASNRKTWTWSGWVKRGNLATGSNQCFFSAGVDGSNFQNLAFNTSDALFFDHYESNVLKGGRTSTAVYRDTSAWYHIVVAYDTTQSTASDRIKIYVNGEVVSDFSSTTDPALNHDGIVNNTVEHRHFSIGYGPYWLFDGYLAEVNFIDGQALTPSDFGETNSSTNQWIPIAYKGSYGTNGFYQKYSTPHGIEAFTTTGSHTWTCPPGVTSVEVLAVGGGGSGGGKYYAGGGGAGGVVHATDYAVTPGVVYDITVGAGGSNASASHQGNDGSDSVFNVNAEGSGITLTATGGGGGGYATGSGSGDGRDGGSGGGGAMWSTSRQGGSTTQNTYSGTTNVTGYGFDGGDGYDNSNNYPAGGGGGAGAVGASSSSSGAGGIGRQFTTFAAYGTDSSNSASTGSNGGYFAGGGGGAGYNNAPQPGGAGGGGTSARGDTGVVATAGLANTGGGGGGASHNTTSEGAAGGSGIVLISVDAGIGADSSGNGNNFTATNLVATDQVLDSPTLNYCTLNPLDQRGTLTLSEGNLTVTSSSSDPEVRATIEIPQSGKWYWEFLMQYSTSFMIGVVDQTVAGDPYTSNQSVLYSSGLGTKYNFSSVASYGATWTTGDLMGIAFNRDDNEITFYKNNSAQPTLTIGGTAAQRARLVPVFATGTGGTGGGTVNFGQDSSFAGAKTAQGNTDGNGIGDFYYSPPSSYLALCSDNLPDPSISDPTAHFNTALYVSNNSTLSVTGVGFQPDFTWHKNRTNANRHALFDSVRGVTKRLASNGTYAEVADPDTLTSFDSDGFSIGADTDQYGVNYTAGSNFVTWCWKAGGTAVSNTDGTITSSVSANTDAGFSIVTFTGNQTSGATVGHGLSQAPEMIIVKGTTFADSWGVYHFPGMGNTHGLLLNSTVAQIDSDTYWNDTTAGASVFTLGNDTMINKTGQTMLAYCFHSVDSYSKVGSYTGNGSSDGTFIYTGFRPAFVMTKSSSSTGNWTMLDSAREPTNVASPGRLYADLSNSESDGATYDFVSNGFKCRETGGPNNSGVTYIYLAFAESPFKTANAR